MPQTGEGRQADANRAATELARRETDVLEAEGNVITASARLAQLLNLNPATRLHPNEAWVVPTPLVPEPIPLRELIADRHAPAARAGGAAGGDPGRAADLARGQGAAVFAERHHGPERRRFWRRQQPGRHAVRRLWRARPISTPSASGRCAIWASATRR